MFHMKIAETTSDGRTKAINVVFVLSLVTSQTIGTMSIQLENFSFLRYFRAILHDSKMKTKLKHNELILYFLCTLELRPFNRHTHFDC